MKRNDGFEIEFAIPFRPAGHDDDVVVTSHLPQQVIHSRHVTRCSPQFESIKKVFIFDNYLIHSDGHSTRGSTWWTGRLIHLQSPRLSRELGHLHPDCGDEVTFYGILLADGVVCPLISVVRLCRNMDLLLGPLWMDAHAAG